MRTVALLSLCLLLFISPWEEYFTIPGFASFSRILGGAAFGLGLLTVVFTGRIRRIPVEFLALGAFIAWSFVGMLWSLDTARTLNLSITYSLLFVLVWLIWEIADTERTQYWLFRAFMLGNCLTLLNVVWRARHAGGLEAGRMAAEGNNANGMAIYLVMAIIFTHRMLSPSILPNRWLPKWVDWTFIVAASVGVLLTASRTGAMALAIYVGLTVLRSPKMGWKHAAVFLLCAVVGVYSIIKLVPEKNIERVMEGRGASSLHDRYDLWARGLDAWKSAPLQGYGGGTYTTVSKTEVYAHNTFINILVEHGLIGLLIWLSFWATLLRRIRRLPSDYKMFWIIIFVTYSPYLMAGSVHYSKLLWLLWGLCLSQSDFIANQWKNKEKKRVSVALPRGRPPEPRTTR